MSFSVSKKLYKDYGLNYYMVYTLLAEAGLPPGLLALLIVAVIWELIWKGFGLWKSAQRKNIIWFIAILIFNTVGILPILYIYVFSELGKSKRRKKRKRK